VVSITGPASLDARFPGQWFQLETGLHYNWHRHYDPTTGRYLQPDPLGFVDGPSVYAYAVNSPQMNVDQEGLSPIAIPAAFCSRYPALCAKMAADVIEYCRKASGGGGRRPPENECDRQKEADDSVCRSLPSPAMRARCWASAADRYGDCLSGRPPRPFRFN